MQPLFAFSWLFALVVIGSFVFLGAEEMDAIKPNQVFISGADPWVSCGVEDEVEAAPFAARHTQTLATPSGDAGAPPTRSESILQGN